jgi:hypothetical protein
MVWSHFIRLVLLCIYYSTNFSCFFFFRFSFRPILAAVENKTRISSFRRCFSTTQNCRLKIANYLYTETSSNVASLVLNQFEGPPTIKELQQSPFFFLDFFSYFNCEISQMNVFLIFKTNDINR